VEAGLNRAAFMSLGIEWLPVASIVLPLVVLAVLGWMSTKRV
jgi:hypothetical protein